MSVIDLLRDGFGAINDLVGAAKTLDGPGAATSHSTPSLTRGWGFLRSIINYNN